MLPVPMLLQLLPMPMLLPLSSAAIAIRGYGTAATVGSTLPYGYAASGHYVADSVGAVHVAKREAEAEPEADADALYGSYGYSGLGYNNVGYSGLGYNNLGYSGLGYNNIGYSGRGYNSVGYRGLGYSRSVGLGYGSAYLG